MGLITLITGLFAVGSGVGAAMDNEKCKRVTETLPNGMEFYWDRKGRKCLLDGTPIATRGYGKKMLIKKLSNGAVIWDGRQQLINKINEKNLEIRDKYKGNRYVWQYLMMCTDYVILDLGLDKVVSSYAKTPDGYVKTYYSNGGCTICELASDVPSLYKGTTAYRCKLCDRRAPRMDHHKNDYMWDRNKYEHGNVVRKITEEEYESIINAPGKEELWEFINKNDLYGWW